MNLIHLQERKIMDFIQRGRFPQRIHRDNYGSYRVIRLTSYRINQLIKVPKIFKEEKLDSIQWESCSEGKVLARIIMTVVAGGCCPRVTKKGNDKTKAQHEEEKPQDIE